MAVAMASQVLDDIDVPAAGTWTIDPGHSTVAFSVRHLMVAKVRGRFEDFSGTIHIAENPQDSWVEATIAAASIDTNEPKRDAHLRSADFFDAEVHPELSFHSEGPLRRTGSETFELPGTLTIRGLARPVVLAVQFNGVTLDPWGGTRAGFSATTTIDREDFGLTWNQVLETGGVMVGKKITIELDVQAVHAPNFVEA